MIKKLLLIVFMFFAILVNAQSVYEFQTENIPYQDLVGSTSLNNGDIWDDPSYTIPMGFDFTISTHTFSIIYVVGWSVGGVLSSTPQDFGIMPLFIPIAQDILSRVASNGTSSSPISYLIEGATGNRIFKIEWRNFGFWEDSTENDFMNMQMWLYEGTNVIEYRYGPNLVNTESFEGETGPIVLLVSSTNEDTDEIVDTAYLLTEDPANPTVLVFEAGDDFDGGALQGSIPDGTVYRFTPQPLSTEDSSKINFQIYPNPTTEFLNIKTQSTDYNLSIYNSLGQRMSVSSIENRIDVSKLSNGIYFIKIETETGSATKKFLKQ